MSDVSSVAGVQSALTQANIQSTIALKMVRTANAVEQQKADLVQELLASAEAVSDSSGLDVTA